MTDVNRNRVICVRTGSRSDPSDFMSVKHQLEGIRVKSGNLEPGTRMFVDFDDAGTFDRGSSEQLVAFCEKHPLPAADPGHVSCPAPAAADEIMLRIYQRGVERLRLRGWLVNEGE